MDNVKIKIINEIKYYSLNDFMRKSTGSKRAVTTCMDKIPREYVYSESSRGRNSCTWVTMDGIKILVTKMPRFPLLVKESIGVFTPYCSECEFEYLLSGFMKSCGIDFKRQYLYDKYNIDFVIESKSIAIEFNELHHRASVDEHRISIIKKKFNVIIVNSNDNIGEFFYKLSEIIWKQK